MPEGKLESRWFNDEEYLNVGNAAMHLGYSGTGFRNLLKRLRGTESEIPLWEIPGAQREKYIKKADLERYLKPRRV